MEFFNILESSITNKIQSFGQKNYSPRFSTILSLLTIATCLSFSLYFIINTLSRTNVSLVSSETRIENAYLDLRKFPIIFNLISGLGQSFNDPDKIFKIVPKIWTRDENQIWSSIDIIAEKCNFEWYPDFQKELTEKYQNADLLCVNPNDSHNRDKYHIKGLYYGNSYLESLSLHISTCVKLEFESSKCFSKEKISQELGFSFLRMIVPNTLIDGNKLTPGKVYLNQMDLLVSQNLFKIFNIEFQEVNFFSDWEFVFEDIEKFTYFNSLSTYIETSIGTREIGDFSAVRIIVADKKINFYRKYTKFQELTAQIGGILKFIFIIAEFINNYYSSKCFLIELYNKNIISHDQIAKNCNIDDHKHIILDKSNLKIKDYDDQTIKHVSKYSVIKIVNNSRSAKIPEDKNTIISIRFSFYDFIFTCFQSKKFKILDKINFLYKKIYSIEKYFENNNTIETLSSKCNEIQNDFLQIFKKLELIKPNVILE